MKIKALKIDAKLGCVIPVEIESEDIIDEIQRMIGADVFTNAGEFGNGRLHIELQDNALLKPIDRMFFAGFYPAPMVGDGLLAAWDEDIDVTAAELQAELSFVPTPDMEQN